MFSEKRMTGPVGLHLLGVQAWLRQTSYKKNLCHVEMCIVNLYMKKEHNITSTVASGVAYEDRP